MTEREDLRDEDKAGIEPAGDTDPSGGDVDLGTALVGPDDQDLGGGPGGGNTVGGGRGSTQIGNTGGTASGNIGESEAGLGGGSGDLGGGGGLGDDPGVPPGNSGNS